MRGTQGCVEADAEEVEPVVLHIVCGGEVVLPPLEGLVWVLGHLPVVGLCAGRVHDGGVLPDEYEHLDGGQKDMWWKQMEKGREKKKCSVARGHNVLSSINERQVYCVEMSQRTLYEQTNYERQEYCMEMSQRTLYEQTNYRYT